MRPSWPVILTAGGVATAALAGLVVFQVLEPRSKPAKAQTESTQTEPEEKLPPSIDCAFRPFMHTSAGVYFYFDVAVSKGEAPRFYQRALVSADGSRTSFAGNDRPVWTYSLDGDGKQVITSPDAATRIVLYGMKLGTPGILNIEAGIRSNVYRNLGGECRQTNLDGDTP